MLSTEEIVIRNHQIRKFFQNKFHIDVDVITTNIHAPMIIYGDKLLACYVKNFKIYFKMNNKDQNSEDIFSFHLKDSLLSKNTDKQELFFMNWLIKAEHKNYYLINIEGTNLMLSGFNFKDKNPNNKENKNMYPVFSVYNPKVYFDSDYCLDLLQKIDSEGLQLIIVNKLH